MKKISEISLTSNYFWMLLAAFWRSPMRDKNLSLNTFIKLARASNSVFHNLERLDPLPEGLSLSQFGVLEALLHKGPLCPHELGEKILKSKGNMTLVIKNLIKEGHVTTVTDPEDKRSYSVHLTPQGEQLIKDLLPSRLETIHRLLSVLTVEEQKNLGTILRKLGHEAGKVSNS
jgi:MarR family 2-MHQ and catechol resistance regulon transcriptional repressor